MTLSEVQGPLKERYREDAAAALVTLEASGTLGEGVSCSLETGQRVSRQLSEAGLHPAAGGDGTVDYLTRTTTVYDDRGDAISSVTEIDQNGDGVIDYTETRTRTVS